MMPMSMMEDRKYYCMFILQSFRIIIVLSAFSNSEEGNGLKFGQFWLTMAHILRKLVADKFELNGKAAENL
jgi:hypothetical protein